MKLLTVLLMFVFLLAGVATAGEIDGKWVSERKVERDGQSFTIVQTFDLKAEGANLTGKISMKFGDNEPPAIEIKDGKIEGSKFSFAAVMQTPNGDMKMNYSGNVEGDTLKGTSEREGGQPRPFEAKRK